MAECKIELQLSSFKSVCMCYVCKVCVFVCVWGGGFPGFTSALVCLQGLYGHEKPRKVLEIESALSRFLKS